jgi:uncharacterized protein
LLVAGFSLPLVSSILSLTAVLYPFASEMPLVEIVLAAAAVLGHGVVWVGLNNRLHAIRIKRSHLKAISAVVHFGTLAVPLVFAWWLYRERVPPGQWHQLLLQHPTALYYVLFCIGMMIVHLPRWLYVRFVVLARARSVGQRLQTLDVAKRLGRWPVCGWKFAVGKCVPCNHVMQVEFNEKRVPIAGLAEELAGLRIVHLSDLHLSGRVEPAFFKEVMREINLLTPDLLLLTGDVFDKVDCLAWIEEILLTVHARYGKFFILGNHDDRLSDVPAARRAIEAAGFADLGGRLQKVMIREKPVCLAGNERPWFTAEMVESLDCQDDAAEKPLKILLSHSPDQFRWAQQRAFDLMLCGHTHGGQIQFPIVGPVVCPSWYGVRYAEGLFLENKPVIHVSRGLSGLFPLRFNCRPAVDLLILERTTSGDGTQ